MTELLALCNGLSLAWDKRFKKLIVKMDSFKSIRLVLRYDYGNLRLANVVLQCQRLLHSNWKVKLQYVWWEGNQVVDKLAKLSESVRCQVDSLDLEFHGVRWPY